MIKVDDKLLSQETINRFTREYLEQVGLYGLDELSNLFELKDRDKKIAFKIREVDYYIVQINSPPYVKKTTLGRIVYFFSGVLSFVSLWIIPEFSEEESESKFLIYDKNLNLLTKEIINPTYWTVSSWWLMENQYTEKYKKNWRSVGNYLQK